VEHAGRLLPVAGDEELSRDSVAERWFFPAGERMTRGRAEATSRIWLSETCCVTSETERIGRSRQRSTASLRCVSLPMSPPVTLIVRRSGASAQ
jgi:hypothetical protein